MILGVAIDAPLRRLFDYRAPPEAQGTQPGERVWVPFGRRRVVGVVVERRETSDVPAARLRSLAGRLDGAPTLEPALLRLLLWAADYYRHPVGEVIASALPAPLRTGAPLVAEEVCWRLTPTGRQCALEQLSSRASRLRAVVEHLLCTEDATPAAIMAATGVPQHRSGRLKGAGSSNSSARALQSHPPVATSVREGPTLNEPQQAAIDRISATFGTFASHLLYGVTGSGKTEVYLHAIARVLARGEQALVLVPEIALTPQLIARFAARFEAPVSRRALRPDDQERLVAWRNAREGAARIVIGTRSAVFTPLARARAHRRRRRARRLVQTAGRVPLFGARPGDRACAALTFRSSSARRRRRWKRWRVHSANPSICRGCRTGPAVRGRRACR